MTGQGAPPSYAARIAPLRPETVWILEGDTLVERVGARAKARALHRLRAIRIVGEAGTARRAAHLTFAGGRALIPAQSLSGARLFEDRSAAFDTFIAALEAAWGGSADGRLRAPPPRAAVGWANALAWGIGLTAAGAVFMIVASLLSGMPSLGVALGARLLFVAILLAAALPWIGREPRA